MTGHIPGEWKTATVTALYKKGDKSSPNNYRPISLTSVVSKTMETIIREELVCHMMDNDLFSSKQYGFLSGRSTVLQLLTVLDKWTSTLDTGGAVDIAYCDFQKAFDKVPHKQLIAKLKCYGVTGNIITWIEQFLTSRTFKVRVGESISGAQDVVSGIPQGSVLGPTLFVIFINDLPDNIVSSEGYLFADDLKAFKCIYQASDCEDFQKDLFRISDWADENHLKLHPDKCCHMRIGKSWIAKPTYKLNINGQQLPLHHTDREKDLGVIIDKSLNFEDHMNEKIKKANSVMGIIRRTFATLDLHNFPILYKSLVRPHLEYANQCWAPHLLKHIESIENVQRRATKRVQGLQDLSYEERLKILKLPSLTYRRLRGDLIETYKILSGKYDQAVSSGLFTINSRNRGHNLKLSKVRSNHDLFKYSFTNRVFNMWNALPQWVVSSPSIQSFEYNLDKHWKNHPLKYSYKPPTDTTELTIRGYYY